MSSTKGTSSGNVGKTYDTDDTERRSDERGGTTLAMRLRAYPHAHRWTALIAAVTVVLSAMQWFTALTGGAPWYGVVLQVAVILTTLLFAATPMPAAAEATANGSGRDERE